MTDVNPNRCGEPMKPLKGALTLQGGEEVRMTSATQFPETSFLATSLLALQIFKNTPLQ
jgi:hypothetical protein